MQKYIFLSFMDLIVWLVIVGLTPLGSDIVNNVQMISAVANIAGAIPWLIVIIFFRKVRRAINARVILLRIREILVCALVVIYSDYNIRKTYWALFLILSTVCANVRDE